jgi:cardiolipin synthase
MTVPAAWGAQATLVAAVAHAAVFAGVALHLLRHRRRTDSTLLWLLAVWALPVAGAVLYAMFGVDRVPRARWRRTAERRSGLQRARDGAGGAGGEPEGFWRRLADAAAVPSDPWAAEMDRTLSILTEGVPLTGGNKITPLLTGDEAFPKMLAAIREARHHVHLQSFIIGNDATGRKFMDALAEKAREGVRVRVLYDRFGSGEALWSGFFRRYRGVEGMSVAGWTQANLFRRQLQFNLRNHRKVLVVDGRIGFVGGCNLHDAERTRGSEKAIQDYHFRVLGPVVHELQYGFLRDWHMMTGEPAEALLTAGNFAAPTAAGGDLARVVDSGPNSTLNRAADLFFQAVCAARRSVAVITPYFLPTDDLLRALRMAALRGVRVELTVPERSNHWYTTWAGRALYEDLLEAGVRLYERKPPFVHAKAMVVDGRMSVVGTANWDVRSLASNFETSLVVYGTGFASALGMLVREDRLASREVPLAAFKARPVWQRYLENACGLLAPLL